jgi:uncharacterized membrane protein
MQTDSAVRQIDEYLASLHKALGKLPPQARDDITKEIRSHILERVEEEGRVTEQTVNEVLRAMGDAREFASQYRTQAVLRRATTSKSPWTLLRATARSATTGLAGVVAFTATIAGYGCALVAYLCALLKPILPSHIGLWLGPEHTLTLGYRASRLAAETYGISVRPPASFVLGTLSATHGPAQELLGPWLFPVTLLLGVLLVFVTTRFARWSIRRFAQRKLLSGR